VPSRPAERMPIGIPLSPGTSRGSFAASWRSNLDTAKFNLGDWGLNYEQHPAIEKEHIANMEQTWYKIFIGRRIPNLPPPVCPARESPP